MWFNIWAKENPVAMITAKAAVHVVDCESKATSIMDDNDPSWCALEIISCHICCHFFNFMPSSHRYNKAWTENTNTKFKWHMCDQNKIKQHYKKQRTFLSKHRVGNSCANSNKSICQPRIIEIGDNFYLTVRKTLNLGNFEKYDCKRMKYDFIDILTNHCHSRSIRHEWRHKTGSCWDTERSCASLQIGVFSPLNWGIRSKDLSSRCGMWRHSKLPLYDPFSVHRKSLNDPQRTLKRP